MIRFILPCDELVEDAARAAHGLVEAVVDHHVVELGGFRQFEFGLGHAAVDHLRGVRAAAFEPSAQLLDRGRHDEHRAGVVAEDALEVDAADHVDVEDDHMALGPDALHLRAQRAVAGSLVDLLPLHEAVFGHGLHELPVREEVVVHPVALLAAGGAAGRRDGEFELRIAFQQPADDGGFARTARGGEYDDFAHLMKLKMKN